MIGMGFVNVWRINPSRSWSRGQRLDQVAGSTSCWIGAAARAAGLDRIARVTSTSTIAALIMAAVKAVPTPEAMM